MPSEKTVDKCEYPGMKRWDSGFDRTRFCRSDVHTFKNPTCCNFNQDTNIRSDIASFLPAECLENDRFLNIADSIKVLACVPCDAVKHLETK